MNLFKNLLETYNRADMSGMVDNKTDYEKKNTVLLPIYHQRKRSDGKNIIKITLSKEGEFIKCIWLEKDEMIVFPATESSQGRSGTMVCSHPLIDCAQYMYQNVKEKKFFEFYIQELTRFMEFITGDEKLFIKIILKYIQESDILKDVAEDLISEKNEIDEYTVKYEEIIKDKIVKNEIDLEKVFLTFEIQDFYKNKNQKISDYINLHKQFIIYENDNPKYIDKKICSISGENLYCTLNHPSLVGKSKLISISNKPEPYKGRFTSGEQITNIGYETSQKIHNMLNYFFSNGNTRRYLGEKSILLNWFSDDIQNKTNYTPADEIDEIDELGELGELPDKEIKEQKLVNKTNKDVLDFISGKFRDINYNGEYNILIVNTINSGRAAIKYYQSIKTSELIKRVQKWYETTYWEGWSTSLKRHKNKTFSLYQIVEYAYGVERENKIILDNKKLKDRLVEDLVIVLIEGRKIPRGLVQKYFNNICSRSRYKNTFNYLLPVACSMLKKYYKDYENKEVSIVLDKKNEDRSYLYGRILAILEKIESDTYSNENSRSTNAERLWSNYTRFPANTLNILMERLKPYLNKLSKGEKIGLAIYYKSMLTDLIAILDEIEDGKTNKSLDKDFIFGYYSQTKDLYTKKEDKNLKNKPKEEENE